MKILFLRGLIASGKSTWAKAWVEEDPEHRFRVNKDDIRLEYPEWKEKMVMYHEENQVASALLAGLDVVIDDTNYNPIHETRFRELAKRISGDTPNAIYFEIKDFEIDPITAIERDALREKPVGKKAISEMYLKHVYKQPKGFKVTGSIILCDLDGTLAFKGDRDIFEFNKVKCDYPNFILASILVQLYIAGNRIVFLSGREDSCRHETEDWIESFMCNIPGVDFHYTLLMRKAGDKRKDDIVKREIFEANFEPKDILCVFDDRKCVRQMWISLGLYVFNCNQEKYDLDF